jgi:cell division protein FtsQ
MKKLVLKILIVVLVIPASVAGVICWLDQKGFFNLDHIEIAIDLNSGGENANSQYLQPLVTELNQQLEQYRGQSLWHLDLPKISHLIHNLPWIETNKISRSWPTRLDVTVHPKDIKFLYLSKSGDVFPVVEDGSLLPSVTPKTAPDVAFLEGAVFENNSAMRKKAVQLMNAIPSEGKFSHQKISELRFDPKEGFWATLIQSGVKVKIGEDNIPLKSARVSRVLEYLETRELEARVIDANLSKKVLVRLRKDP